MQALPMMSYHNNFELRTIKSNTPAILIILRLKSDAEDLLHSIKYVHKSWLLLYMLLKLTAFLRTRNLPSFLPGV